MLGAVGALPDIYTELEISYFLLRRLLGVRTEGDKKGAKVSGRRGCYYSSDCSKPMCYTCPDMAYNTVLKILVFY